MIGLIRRSAPDRENLPIHVPKWGAPNVNRNAMGSAPLRGNTLEDLELELIKPNTQNQTSAPNMIPGTRSLILVMVAQMRMKSLSVSWDMVGRQTSALLQVTMYERKIWETMNG